MNLGEGGGFSYISGHIDQGFNIQNALSPIDVQD